ncbi:hypothetical protein A8924_3100 [Saccharopolyspora erythraea NRRL 2338]|uniref:Uncharacterized protein n=1 Tax=Saccharopolyspora erythraea TaxID=1836 RepID=A0ABP3NJM7_SACER|nr:hypothetical protein [Saccharopolyspora erythraea]EQD86257.1 hypothetical protein N599_10490 [Saccharopolyspora erythraea D]PFG95738.1 hypothetical protein A8924_3100 [Saccharopolyspora erythraea NRRL 2338]QRK92334.1 hypothetical protein JQX30_14020 [Saccharopolyspora erythraea]
MRTAQVHGLGFFLQGRRAKGQIGAFAVAMCGDGGALGDPSVKVLWAKQDR